MNDEALLIELLEEHLDDLWLYVEGADDAYDASPAGAAKTDARAKANKMRRQAELLAEHIEKLKSGGNRKDD